jgi:ethanolamine ammonia-lyase small subunit
VTGLDPWAALRSRTPARIGLGHSGGSLPTAAHLDFQLAHARARDAVHHPLDVAALAADLRRTGLRSLPVRSAVTDRRAYLTRPDLGRRLDAESRERVKHLAESEESPDVAFVVADGLSALAPQRHSVPLLAALMPALGADGWRVSSIVVAEQARVALGDEIGELLGASLVAVLIGERPGLSSPDSLGIYLTWGPKVGRTDAERNCISNVRPDGLACGLAALRLRFLLTEARRRKLTGVGLKDDVMLTLS